MRCEVAREALSARLDGEREAVPASRVDDHLAACAECTAWYVAARQLSFPGPAARDGASAPDLTGQILAAARGVPVAGPDEPDRARGHRLSVADARTGGPAGGRRPRPDRHRWWWRRWSIAGAAVIAVAVIVPMIAYLTIAHLGSPPGLWYPAGHAALVGVVAAAVLLTAVVMRRRRDARPAPGPAVTRIRVVPDRGAARR